MDLFLVSFRRNLSTRWKHDGFGLAELLTWQLPATPRWGSCNYLLTTVIKCMIESRFLALGPRTCHDSAAQLARCFLHFRCDDRGPILQHQETVVAMPRWCQQFGESRTCLHVPGGTRAKRPVQQSPKKIRVSSLVNLIDGTETRAAVPWSVSCCHMAGHLRATQFSRGGRVGLDGSLDPTAPWGTKVTACGAALRAVTLSRTTLRFFVDTAVDTLTVEPRRTALRPPHVTQGGLLRPLSRAAMLGWVSCAAAGPALERVGWLFWVLAAPARGPSTTASTTRPAAGAS